MNNKLAVIALGGNAIVPNDQGSSFEFQQQQINYFIDNIILLINDGWSVVLTHGNGPQVGFILQASEQCKDNLPTTPFDIAVSQTQGSIGYMFTQALYNRLSSHLSKKIAAIITKVVVDENDFSFQNPTKPIGSYMDLETAKNSFETLDWKFIEDSGRGYRRVVASPKPLKIIELDLIKTLVENNYIVIACGGGGIACCQDSSGIIKPVDAVIDKDLSSALLAKQLKANLFIIPTAVEQVSINFNKPNQQQLSALSIYQAKKYIESGEFGKGSMQPKVEAIIDYISENPAGTGVITDIKSIYAASKGLAGTIIQQ